MREAMELGFGNPSSDHWAGRPARALVERARGQVAGLLGCKASEIVFTSGGTESNNHALKGSFFASNHATRHFITSAIEHPATLMPLKFLAGLGAEVTVLPVDGAGRVNPDDLRQAIRPETILISLMHANNETGVIQPIAECAAIAREHGIAFHSDAAQSAGKIPVRVAELGVDFLSLAGHKIYAPKGIGALYIRNGAPLEPVMHGAGHESGRRAGTESALLTAALGQACEMVSDLSPMAQVGALRDRLWTRLRDKLGDRVVLNGHAAPRLPNTLNLSFVGRVGAEILAALDGVAASTGSACHAGQITLSPVLSAMAVPEQVGMGAIRFSLGRETTVAEIDAVADRLLAVLQG